MPRTTHPNREPGTERPRVLIADDEPRIRRALSRFLAPSGYVVFEAGDGAEAIIQARDNAPDIAVVDLRMPRTDGFTAVRMLKAMRGEDLHVIVLSGADDAEHRLRAFDAGADDFLAKPANLDELVRRIEASRRSLDACRAERRARERAEQLRLMNSEAVSLVAHDLNNGFAVIMGNLTYLEETLELDVEQKDALDSSVRALRRMIGLTSNFVDVSRLEDGAITPQLSDVDLAAMIPNAAAIHDPGNRNPRSQFEVYVEPGLRARIDPALVERLLHNLLGNALRYVQTGGTVAVRGSAGAGDQVFIEVTNTGPAIPESLRSSLFEKYRKGADGKAMRGMGLYFCRLACEAHGGSIRVDSDEGVTRFTVALPGRLAARAAPPATTTSNAAA
jgi:two-component system, sensor histidine kinase and response regulator